MDEKTKLLVFEKKEVFLIFIFVILVGITSFTIGIRIGKNFALKQSGITPSDVKNVAHLKSTEEEALESLTNKEAPDAHGAEAGHGQEAAAPLHAEEAGHGHAEAAPAASGHDSHEEPAAHSAPADTHAAEAGHGHAEAAPVAQEKEGDDTALKKLEDEFKKLDIEERSSDSNKKKIIEASENDTIQDKLKSAGDLKSNKREPFKYTIQLGSYPTLQEAEKFADGFRIRGYNPIVYETTLQNKGIWYRVSLGSFESMNEAKVYVQKEESLFAGQDYVITEMK